jgi:hypothetical protein
MATVDPFTQVHQAIWAALTAHAPWAQLVLAANRQDMSNPLFQQPPPDLQAADSPGATIVQDQFVMRPLGDNSQTADFSQDYTLVLTTDRLSVAPINQVKYLTAVALLKAGIDLGLPGLVRDWTIASARDASGDKKLTRESQRWAATLTISVKFYLSRSALLAT